MRNSDGFYLNGNNSTVQVTLAHDTSEVQVFNSPLFGDIRVITDENGNPLFCASDVCNQLGYSNGRKAVQDHVDIEDVTKRDTLTKGGLQSMTYVNESGLYALILSSKRPDAKSYKNWVTKDVLPTIRKTGGYYIQHQYPGASILRRGPNASRTTTDANRGATEEDRAKARGDNGIESGERRATEAKRVHPCYLAKQANSTGHPDSARLRDERKKVQRLTS